MTQEVPMTDTYTITLDARYVDAWLAWCGVSRTADEYDRWADDAGDIAAAINCHVRAQLLRQVPRPLVVGHLARTPTSRVVLVLYVGERGAFVRYSDGEECSWFLDDLTYAGPAPEGWPNHEETNDE